jgi:tetratricopeptide (TPR) repeat protein
MYKGQYKGQAVDVKQVGRELGVRYVLEGSVRKAGQKVRITGQLIDAVTGAHIWADRFDGSLDDVFELQDNVASSVAGVIEPALQAAEIRRSADRPTGDLTAYDLYLRALAQSPSERGIVVALDLLRRAIERDPYYASALAGAAFCHMRLHVSGWSKDPDQDQREGINLAHRAIQVTDDDPVVLAWSAYALAYFGEDIDSAIQLIDRALALNPSFAHGWLWSGWLRLWSGQPQLAISHFETSLRLSPHARTASIIMGIGVGYFVTQRFEEAVAMLLRSLQEQPDWAPTYRMLATCYAHMGRLDEARETIERLKAITPLVVPDARHWRNPEHRELYLSGLRLAAGEAT